MEKKEFIEKLILEVEAQPAIYNKSSGDYKLRHKKANAWIAVAGALGQDGNWLSFNTNCFARVIILTFL